MSEFFGSIVWLAVSLGLLVTFHEFGHYWVARRCGVRVLRFSIGFGRTLWRRVGRDGTEYVIAALPLGGYVKMLDEREGDVAPSERAQAFTSKPVGQRIAIVAAGPAANLVLCLGLLWLMFVIGKPDYQPDVGRVTGLAAEAGFQPGDRLLQVGDRNVATWTAAGIALSAAIAERAPVTVTVREADGDTRQRALPLDRTSLALADAKPLSELGLFPAQWLLPAVVGEVSADSAAAGRLEPGDRLLSVNGEAIDAFDSLGPLIQRHANAGPGPAPASVTLGIERGGKPLSVSLTPHALSENGQTRWVLGILPAASTAKHDALLQYGPLDAVLASFAETRQMTQDTLAMIGRMLSGKASLDNISGPITIARVANSSAGMGIAWFLNFLALLSLSLCIMNLLPIPVLDGGHLLYYLIELALGRPMDEQVLEAGQYIGLALLAGLMGLAFYNDILHLLS